MTLFFFLHMKRSDVAASLSPENSVCWLNVDGDKSKMSPVCSDVLIHTVTMFPCTLESLENATTGTHWSKLGLNGTVHHEINKKDVFPLTFSAVCPTRLFWCELPSVGAISRRAVPSLGYNGTRWHRTFWCSKQKNTLGKNSRMSHRP